MNQSPISFPAKNDSIHKYETQISTKGCPFIILTFYWKFLKGAYSLNSVKSVHLPAPLLFYSCKLSRAHFDSVPACKSGSWSVRCWGCFSFMILLFKSWRTCSEEAQGPWKKRAPDRWLFWFAWPRIDSRLWSKSFAFF